MKEKESKLVRNNIPSIIQSSGKQPSFHTAENDEYKRLLYEKLREEVDEFLNSDDPTELGDVLEVVYAIGEVNNLTKEQLEHIREQKAAVNGPFTKRIVLDIPPRLANPQIKPKCTKICLLI